MGATCAFCRPLPLHFVFAICILLDRLNVDMRCIYDLQMGRSFIEHTHVDKANIYM
jgi:hypothetical protein